MILIDSWRVSLDTNRYSVAIDFYNDPPPIIYYFITTDVMRAFTFKKMQQNY